MGKLARLAKRIAAAAREGGLEAAWAEFADSLESVMLLWSRLWMPFTGTGPLGRTFTRLASWGCPPYKGRLALARLHPRGYISPRAIVRGRLRRGRHVFIGEGVTIYREPEGGEVILGDHVHLHRDILIEVGLGGAVQIGAGTHIQPRCQLTSYAAPIEIGSGVDTAPACAFYSSDHGMAPNTPIRRQPMRSRGPIVVGDDAWLGYGVIVLSGVRIGKGAVVGAGSVVTRDIPDRGIAVGNPARVLRLRDSLTPASTIAAGPES
jgi:acetyltransferase-like isoleucine patch superfamily enzyme